MLITTGEFKKKNGELRKMKFLKISDMSTEIKEKLGLLEESKKEKKKLAENSEIVYDIEVKGFRIFNWNSIISEVFQEEIEYEI